MKTPIVSALVALFAFASNAEPLNGPTQTPGPTGKPFVVFDNMAYAGKPDTTRVGLIPSSVHYYRPEWKTAIEAGQLPDETLFKESVQKKSVGRPGPIVIDIEYVYLSRTHGLTDAQVKQHFELFITLAKWAHEAAPGHIVGYYGHGLFPEEPGAEYPAETQSLIAAVDAFFPSMYVFGNQPPEKWKEKLQSLVRKAYAIAPGKPVYPYLWPQYHEGAPKAGQFVDGEFMKFQLDTAHDCGVDGAVFWSGGKPAWTPEWDTAPWWQEVVNFVAEKPIRKQNAEIDPPKTGKDGKPTSYEAE